MTEASEPPRGAHLTLAQVVEATGVSLSTVKRRQGQFAHAYKDDAGVWRVPVSDLLGAGLKLRSGSLVDQGQSVIQASDLAADPSGLVAAQAKIEALTEQLTNERIARAAAEATVSAYRDNLQDLRRSLNAITGPPPAAEPPAREVSPPAATAPAAASGSAGHQPLAGSHAANQSLDRPRRRWPWSRAT